MFRRLLTVAMLLVLPAASPTFAQSVSSVPAQMQFQGRLSRPDGTPVMNSNNQALTFRLFADQTGGEALWAQTLPSVAVRNGVFGALLDFTGGFAANQTLKTVFGGAPWLEIQLGNDTPLPRQPFASAAFAFKADTANTANSVVDGSITGASLANGSITADKFAPNLFNPLAWLLGGNSGTNPDSHFLGTTDNQPLVFKVNGKRAMRFNYVDMYGAAGINVLGGSDVNMIHPETAGATIAGGGSSDYPNRIIDSFGTIGGGVGNQVGGPYTNAGMWYATVAGGFSNTASGSMATVGGGRINTASGFYSTVIGGSRNTASGRYSTVLGGNENTAAGDYSCAAGFRAKANDYGTFVWSGGDEFISTGNYQFLINALGGVGINTNNPAGFALNVNGTANFSGALSAPNATLPLLSGNVSVGGSFIATGAGTFGGALSVGNSLVVTGGGTFGGGLSVNQGNSNNTALLLTSSGPGWASGLRLKNTAAGGYEYGLYSGSDGKLHVGNVGDSVDVLTINPGGNVGIGTTTPNVRLDVNGPANFNGNVTVNGVTYTSDARYKTNVATFPDALDTLLNLRGVTFDWKRQDFPDRNFAAGRQVGFLAQEVEKILPELVQTDANGYKRVAYQNVVPVLVEAVKTLKTRNDAEIQTLKQVVEDKQRQIEALEIRIRRLEALEARIQTREQARGSAGTGD
jgi:hypothetical protein